MFDLSQKKWAFEAATSKALHLALPRRSILKPFQAFKNEVRFLFVQVSFQKPPQLRLGWFLVFFAPQTLMLDSPLVNQLDSPINQFIKQFCPAARNYSVFYTHHFILLLKVLECSLLTGENFSISRQQQFPQKYPENIF